MTSPMSLALALVLDAAPPDDPVALRWDAPAECPDAPTVGAWVDALAPVGDAEPLAVSGTIVADAEGYALSLELAGEPKVTRTLHAEDCAALGRAAAVVIAIAIDPVAGARSEGVVRALQVPEAPALPAPNVDDTPRADAFDGAPAVRGDRGADLPPVRASPLEGGVSLGVGADALLLPSSGPGLSIAPFVGTRAVYGELALQYWTPRSTAEQEDGLATRVQLVTAGLRGCGQLARGRVRVPLCGGVDAGGVFARARGDRLGDASPAGAPWAGVVLAPAVRIRVAPRVSIGFGLEAVISLYRARFGVLGREDDLFVVGAGGVRGLVSVQLHDRREKP